jgi:hypothetical protein
VHIIGGALLFPEMVVCMFYSTNSWHTASLYLPHRFFTPLGYAALYANIFNFVMLAEATPSAYSITLIWEFSKRQYQISGVILFRLVVAEDYEIACM